MKTVLYNWKIKYPILTSIVVILPKHITNAPKYTLHIAKKKNDLNLNLKLDSSTKKCIKTGKIALKH